MKPCTFPVLAFFWLVNWLDTRSHANPSFLTDFDYLASTFKANCITTRALKSMNVAACLSALHCTQMSTTVGVGRGFRGEGGSAQQIAKTINMKCHMCRPQPTTKLFHIFYFNLSMKINHKFCILKLRCKGCTLREKLGSEHIGLGFRLSWHTNILNIFCKTRDLCVRTDRIKNRFKKQKYILHSLLSV